MRLPFEPASSASSSLLTQPAIAHGPGGRQSGAALVPGLSIPGESGRISQKEIRHPEGRASQLDISSIAR
jgi:hypothetical protein